MRRIIAGFAFALLLAAPADAARPISCSATAGTAAYFNVRAVGLDRNTDYAAWWTVAHEDDGMPFYYAGQSPHPSDRHGRWTSQLPTFGRHGYWYVYIGPYAQTFNPDLALAVCEFHD